MLIKTKPRKGMILLVIVAFLAMFTVIGTTYLLLGDVARKTSEFDIQATDKKTAFQLMTDITPQYILNRALGQIIYDVQPLGFDGNRRLATENSSLRGHGLSSDMYGNYDYNLFNLPYVPLYNPALSNNFYPFTGTGKDATEAANLMNYMSFGAPTPISPLELMVFDPGSSLKRRILTLNTPAGITSTWNQPSTFADANHSYLGRYLYPNRLGIKGKISNGSDMITNVIFSGGSSISDLTVEMPIDFIPGIVPDDSQVSASHPPLPFYIKEINKTDLANITIKLNQNFLPGPSFDPASSRDFVVSRFIPSFHRETVFGSMRTNFSGINSTPTITSLGNPNWLPNSWGPRTADNNFVIDANRHRTLRPRPFDQLTATELTALGGFLSPREAGVIDFLNTKIANNQIFPYPEADGMDVKNLEGYPGGNDSIWIDAGFPVMTTPDGRKYKVLIAPLILDLDGKVNLNVAGNLMLRNTDPSTNNRPNYYEFNANHGSNQGIGRWEINPQKLISNYPGFSPLGHPFNPLSITQNPFPGGPPVFQNEFLNLLSFKIPTDPSLPSSRTSPLVPAPIPLDDSFPYEPGTAGSDKAASLQGILSDYYRPLQLEIGRFYHPNFVPTITNYIKPDGFSANPSYFSYPTPPAPYVINNIAAGSTIPHSYARVDFNAAKDDANPPGTIPVPPAPMARPVPVLGTSVRLDYSTLTTFGFPNFDIPDVLNSSFKGSNNSLDNLFTETRIKTEGRGQLPYHARYFNPYQSSATITSGLSNISTVFPPNETAALLRWTGKGELFQASKLARLMPKSLGLDMPYEQTLPDGLFRHAVRNMVTTLSADLERPAMVPIDVDIATDPASRFAMDPTYDYPRKGRAGPIADIGQPTINRTTPALKLNLSRTLTNYPVYNKTEGAKPVAYDLTVANVSNQYAAALAERQDFARDIFDYLKNVTGVAKMGSPKDLVDFPLASPILADPEVVKVNRWLAQLAVNIVDFIDNDDFNTQFQWDVNDPSRAKEFLFGIEMPRLVINEVFVQARNPDGASDGAAPYQVNTVVEFLNPLPADTNYDDKPGSHAALLQYDGPVAGTPILNYKLSLIKRGIGDEGTTTKTGNLKDEINLRIKTPVPMEPGPFETKYFGDLDDQPTSAPPTAGIDQLKLSKWKDASTFTEIPAGTFYKVGDSNNGNTTPGGSTPPAPPAVDYKSDDLKIECIKEKKEPNDDNCPQVVLQRLAVPGLPPQPNPALSSFNPYITVDVFSSKGKMNDARVYNVAGAIRVGKPLAERLSAQRKTPFLDNRSKPINFDDGSSDNISVVAHTIGLVNDGEKFPMLVHLDRKLINPLELLNVACCFPHEFTQRATRWHTAIPEMVGGVNIDKYPYAANWPWFDENTRLYRFLEAVAVEPLQNGEALNGRSLGKININTMPHANVFHALCDGTEVNYPSAANNFDRTNIETVYNRLKNKYTSFGQEVNLNYGDPNLLKGFQNSILGSLTPTTGNIIPARSQLDLDAYGVVTFNGTGDTQNQLARRELLSKIANSVTTKSNTFAVWITAGYFEVRDDTTQPPKLGAEIGKADGVNIRHRMFAMIDRTHLKAADCLLRNAAGVVVATPITFNTDVDYDAINNYYSFKNTPAPGVTGEWVPIPAGTVLSIKNPVSGAIVPATAGMILVLDPNTDYEETVQLEVIGGVAGFYVRKEHYPRRSLAVLPGRPQRYNSISTINSIIIRGNPGPWKNYDYRLDPLVVPYAEIIE